MVIVNQIHLLLIYTMNIAHISIRIIKQFFIEIKIGIRLKYLILNNSLKLLMIMMKNLLILIRWS
jgi:hypothetical protein